VHEETADRQAAAAAAAERLRQTDAEYEGERLGEPVDRPRR
jgi:hypothetical protein